jgi:hypothetical protein
LEHVKRPVRFFEMVRELDYVFREKKGTANAQKSYSFRSRYKNEIKFYSKILIKSAL